MKAVLQRVSKATVSVSGNLVGRINAGLVVLLGIAQNDTVRQADAMVNKMVHLRIFPDENGRMNQSLLDIGGEILLISQFTLLCDCSHGRRPSFFQAASSMEAKSLYCYTGQILCQQQIKVEYGRFGAKMQLELTNEGPVTICLDTDDFYRE